MGAPLVPDPMAIELQRRAAMLRTFAARLDAALTNDLVRRAGPDVWIGPAADDCFADLTMLRTGLVGSADQLRARARVLEQRAAAIPLGGATPSTGPR